MSTPSAYNWNDWASQDIPVLDSRGEEMGRVSDAREGYFKVNAPKAFDYWLPFDTIAEAGSDAIRLRITKDEAQTRKNDDAAESLTSTEIEESTDDRSQSLPVERRYEQEAEYLSRPRQP